MILCIAPCFRVQRLKAPAQTRPGLIANRQAIHQRIGWSAIYAMTMDVNQIQITQVAATVAGARGSTRSAMTLSKQRSWPAACRTHRAPLGPRTAISQKASASVHSPRWWKKGGTTTRFARTYAQTRPGLIANRQAIRQQIGWSAIYAMTMDVNQIRITQVAATATEARGRLLTTVPSRITIALPFRMSMTIPRAQRVLGARRARTAVLR